MTEESNILWTGRSVNGVLIRLESSGWRHIITGHPEMEEHYNRVLETVEDPDFIQEGEEINEFVAVRLYAGITESRKYLMVAYREVNPTDGFIKTAYLRYRPSTTKRIIWTL